MRRVSGRMNLSFGAALYNFRKAGRIQMALHRLKYENRPDIGRAFGELYGKRLVTSPHYLKPDYLIAIPLHSKRQHKRGYNQSEQFALGISAMSKVPVRNDFLTKPTDLVSQTHKNREDRFNSVLDSIRLNKAEQLRGKRIMIVDDVMTTGATMEAAYTKFSNIPGIDIQLGLIALADG